VRKHWAMSFYQGRLWQQQRKHALHRDQYTCQDCGAAAEEVHHLTPLTPGNIDDYRVSLALDSLMSLCHRCHTARHEGTAATSDGFVFDESGQVVPR
jgi:5-methylcytosine-specific restriction endonuclease McrA